MKRPLFLSLFLVSTCLAEPVDITHCPKLEDRSKSLAVTTGDAVLIRLPSGAVAVVQLTSIGEARATYRWRFRHSATGALTEGTRRVFEDYDRVKKPDGHYQLTRRNRPEDLLIQAGDVRFEWSHKDNKTSWIYYCPEKATMTVIPAADYESNP